MESWLRERRWLLVAAALTLAAVAVWWAFAEPPAGPMVVPKPSSLRARAGGSKNDPTRAPAKELEDEPAADDPAPPAPPPGDLLELLGRRDLEAGMDKIRPRLEQCRGPTETATAAAEENAEASGADSKRENEAPSVVTVRLTIAKTGQVQSVTVLPPHDRSALADCVARVVRTASFPRFRGTLVPTVELTYPIVLR